MSHAQSLNNPPNRQRKPRTPKQAERIPDAHLNALSGIFPGFGDWYRANYDEQGQPLIRSNPGLPHPPGEKEEA